MIKEKFLSWLHPWSVFPWTPDEHLRQRLHWIRNATDDYLRRHHGAIGHFLLEAVAYCQEPQLLSSFEREVDRLRRLLDWELAHYNRMRPDDIRRSLTALQRCACFFKRAVPASRIPLSQTQDWDPSSLQSPEDVSHLLDDLEQMMETAQLNWNDFQYLPRSIRDALVKPSARTRFCRQVLDSPALKGHLVDLYRGCREVVAA